MSLIVVLVPTIVITTTIDPTSHDAVQNHKHPRHTVIHKGIVYAAPLYFVFSNKLDVYFQLTPMLDFSSTQLHVFSHYISYQLPRTTALCFWKVSSKREKRKERPMYVHHLKSCILLKPTLPNYHIHDSRRLYVLLSRWL